LVRFQLVYVAYTEHNLLDLIIPDLLFIHGVLVYVQYTELNFLYLRIPDLLFIHGVLVWLDFNWFMLHTLNIIC